VVQANRRVEELYGYSGEELRGMTAADLRAPEARDGAEATVRQAVAGGPVLVETVHRRRDGSTFPVEVSVHHADVRGERFLLEIVRDIGPQKAAEARITQLNRLLRTISEINQLIVRERDRDRLLGEACRILVGHGGFRMAWVGFADEGSGVVVPAAWAGHEDGYLGSVTIRLEDSPFGRGPTGTAIREGRAVAVEDWEADERVAPWREAARRRGYASSAAYPIPVGGAVTGAFTVYAAETGAFGAEVTVLLGELAGDIGLALEAMNAAARREAAERSLAGSEERFRIAAETSNDVVYEWDLKQSVQWFGNIDEILGYGPGEFPRTLGGWAASVHPDDLERVMAALRAQMEKQVPYAIEYRIRTHDGAYRWWTARGATARTPDGKPVRWVGTVTDITERKRAEALLKENEERFHLVADLTYDMEYWQAPDGSLIYVSPSCERTTGYRAEEFSRDPDLLIRIVHPDDRARFEAHHHVEPDEPNGPDHHDLDLRIVSRSGEERWINHICGRVYSRDGAYMGLRVSDHDITARKRAEEALKTSEEKYRGILENMEESYFEVDLAGTLTFFNDSLCRLLGYPRDELLGMNNRHFTDKEHTKKVFQAFNKVYTTGEPTREVDWEIIRKDGTKGHIETSASLRRDSSGQPIGFSGLFREVTERKRAEETLRESEERYRLIAENTADVIWTLDLASRRFTYMSPSVERLRGFSAEEMLAQPFEASMTPDSLRRVDAYLAAALARFAAGDKSARNDTVEADLPTKGGGIVRTEIVATALTDASGRVTSLLGVTREISERKRAEAALRESEARYRSLFDQSPIGIYRTTPDGRILAANAALLWALGYASLEELTARNLHLDGYEPTYPRQEFKERIERDGEVIGFESAWLKKDGQVLGVRESARVVRGQDGKTLYYEGTIEDVTAQRRGEEERRHLVAAIEQASETIVITDTEGRIEYVNPAFERTCGYTRDEANGQKLSMLDSGEHDDAYYATLWQTITQSEMWQGHFVNRRKDGSLYEEEATISPIRDNRGTIVSFVEVKRDVTQEMALQAQLRQA